MAGRVVAILGLMLILAGVILPAECPDAGSCDPTGNGLINLDAFSDDTDAGIIASIYGMLVLAVAFPALIAIISNEQGAMLFSALSVTSITALSYGVLVIQIADDSSISYGWIALGGGSLFLLGAAVIMQPVQVVAGSAIATTAAPSAMGGAFGDNKTRVEGMSAGNKTRIEGMPSAAGGMNKTVIEADFGRQQGYGGVQQQTPPQQQQPLPPMPGFGDQIDPMQKTAVDFSGQKVNPDLKTQVDGPVYGADAFTPPSEPTPASAPPPQPAPQNFNMDGKTMIDKIAPPEPEELDPFAWKKELEQQQQDEQLDPDIPTTKVTLPPDTPPESQPPPQDYFKTNIDVNTPAEPIPVLPADMKTNISPDDDVADDPSATPDEAFRTFAEPMPSDTLLPPARQPAVDEYDESEATAPLPLQPGSVPHDDEDDALKTFIQPVSDELKAPPKGSGSSAAPTFDDLDNMKTMIDMPDNDGDDD